MPLSVFPRGALVIPYLQQPGHYRKEHKLFRAFFAKIPLSIIAKIILSFPSQRRIFAKLIISLTFHLSFLLSCPTIHSPPSQGGVGGESCTTLGCSVVLY